MWPEMNAQPVLNRTTLRACAALGLMLCLPGARGDDFQGATHLVPFDEDTIGYSKAAATGSITRLQKRIDRREVTLRHDDAFGYLVSLLAELNISTNSQMLVFSKTSFRRERGPKFALA